LEFAKGSNYLIMGYGTTLLAHWIALCDVPSSELRLLGSAQACLFNKKTVLQASF